ncbi:hypothetical protein QSI_0855 [Clostridioides difficile P28]|nr:hypothetical protein QSI_0855 [Clostridioides difficile P28]
MSQCGYLLKQRYTDTSEKDGMYPFYVQGRKFLAPDPLRHMRIAFCILRKML